MHFVLDASAALSLIFVDETSRFSERLEELFLDGGQALVPSIFLPEVTNALLNAVKRSRATESQALDLLSSLGSLPISISEPTVSPHELFRLGHSHQLSAYDALYLHLSLAADLPLCTQDDRLAEAATSAGVELVPEVES